MSLYAGLHIDSRTAGYIPGVTVAPASPSAKPSSPSPSGRQSFDTLLQEAGSSPSFPHPSGSAPVTAHQAPAQKNVTPDFTADTAADQKRPASAQTHNTDNRTAGRNVEHNSDNNAQGKGWSFFDFLDVINPLHHLPVIGNIYRAVTGDQINSTARIMGGAIFGGPVGAAFGVANAVMDESTGRDIGENVFAFVRNGGGDEDILQGPVPLPSGQTTLQNGAQNFAKITKDDIIWSQPQATPSQTSSPPRLDETLITGPGAASQHIPSLKPAASAARENSTTRTDFLPSHPPTHPTHPMPGGMAEKRPPVAHSLHTIPVGHNTETSTTVSKASDEGERNQKESLNAGQENVGSPMFLSLQEAPAEGEGLHPKPELIAHHDMPLKMIDALDKYQAVMTRRYQN